MSIKSKSNSIVSDKSSKSAAADEQEALAAEAAAASELALDENAPKPRLCHLKKWPNFQGYGFNLHAERNRQGQHIGKVDVNSPAESAGLREGDRIIEVNYVNISNENHQQVVKRIRNGLETNGALNENEVVLLVMDSAADDFYRKLNIIVKHDFASVLKLSTADKPTTVDTTSNSNEILDNKSDMSKSTSSNVSATMNSSSNETNTNNDNNNNNNNKSNSESTDNLNEIRSVNHTPLDEHKLDTNLIKQYESTSSTSNLSDNSSDNQSKSSKSNVPTPTSQKKDSSFSNRPETIISTTSINKSNNSPVITTSTPTTPKSHLINGAVDPFHETLNSKFDKAYKTVCEMFDKNSARTETPSIYSNTNFSERTTAAAAGMPPRRPPPLSASATLNFKKLLSSYKTNRASCCFDCKSNTSSNSNMSENKKSLDTYLEMSAAEFKSYLKSKSRNDPRVAPVDMKQKFQMFQDM